MEKIMILRWIKLILATVLLLFAIFEDGYSFWHGNDGFFILTKFVLTAFFGIMAYNYFQKKQKEMLIVSIALALLFQPIVGFPLEDAWVFVFIATAIFLIYLFFKERKEEAE